MHMGYIDLTKQWKVAEGANYQGQQTKLVKKINYKKNWFCGQNEL